MSNIGHLKSYVSYPNILKPYHGAFHSADCVLVEGTIWETIFEHIQGNKLSKCNSHEEDNCRSHNHHHLYFQPAPNISQLGIRTIDRNICCLEGFYLTKIIWQCLGRSAKWRSKHQTNCLTWVDRSWNILWRVSFAMRGVRRNNGINVVLVNDKFQGHLAATTLAWQDLG